MQHFGCNEVVGGYRLRSRMVRVIDIWFKGDMVLGGLTVRGLRYGYWCLASVMLMVVGGGICRNLSVSWLVKVMTIRWCLIFDSGCYGVW